MGAHHVRGGRARSIVGGVLLSNPPSVQSPGKRVHLVRVLLHGPSSPHATHEGKIVRIGERESVIVLVRVVRVEIKKDLSPGEVEGAVQDTQRVSPNLHVHFLFLLLRTTLALAIVVQLFKAIVMGRLPVVLSGTVHSDLGVLGEWPQYNSLRGKMRGADVRLGGAIRGGSMGVVVGVRDGRPHVHLARKGATLVLGSARAPQGGGWGYAARVAELS